MNSDHPAPKISDEDKGFIKGVAWAVQIVARRGENTLARKLISESGCKLKDFKMADVDEDDMKAVCEKLKEYEYERQRLQAST